MKRWMLVVIAALAISVAGCKKEEAPAPEQAATAVQPTATSPALPNPAQVPVKDDFEAQAEREVTADNYEAQLEALAKEIEAPAP